MKKILNRLKSKKVIGVIAAILIVFIAAMVMLLTPYAAEQDYLDMVYDNNQISVSEVDGWYELIPSESSNDEAIIFYPGGLVSANAYLYMLSEIAIETKQPIYVVKFPLSLAVTNIDAADVIIDNYTNVNTWTIAGHSLGGSMACRYAKANTDKITNLLMFASYCDQSISDSNISVLTLYGSLNNGINDAVLLEYEKNLPEDTVTIIIPGMNHAQFGNYGPQRGDSEATISNDDATSIVTEKAVAFILRNSDVF